MAAPSPSSSSSVSFFEMDKSISKNINALLEGVKWGAAGIGTDATIYYSFPTSNVSSLWSTDYTNNFNSELYSGFSALSSFQQTQATAALQSWANVASVDIQYVATETTSAVGDIRIATTTGSDMTADIYAYAYLPSGAYGGDVWINANQPVETGNNYNYGGNGYQTILHELGHALGLSHPFEGTVKLNSAQEYFKYTVMSYSDAPKHEDSGFSSFYPTTPMLLDIQAMQYLYGANMRYNESDNVYVFDENATYYQTIWDAGGSDTIQYNSNAGGTINLNAGNFSRMGQAVLLDKGTATNETIAIAYNVTIENAIGGNGNDVITGNAANNRIDGGAGVDRLTGGKGDDTYIVDIALSATKVVLKDKITESKSAGNDTLMLRGDIATSGTISTIKLLSNVENIDLSLTNAIHLNLVGDKNANVLIGNAGNNILDGSTGIDTLIGHLGNDTYVIDRVGDVITESADEGVDTVIIKYSASGFYTLSDTLENATISNTKAFDLVGSAFDNLLTGNRAANSLYGGLGADTLFGAAGKDKLQGAEGNDILSGGSGADTFIWSLTDKGTIGVPSLDIVTDFNLKQKDVLNLKDLLDGESKSDVDNLLNFIDITSSDSQTEIHISAVGAFSHGIYDASLEDTSIILQNINLLSASAEADLLSMMVAKNYLILD
jgi:serralysin